MTQGASARASTDWRVVALLFCVGLFAAAQFGKIALTLDEVAAFYGRPAAALAYLVSVVGVVGVLFGVVAGRLVANLGARPVLLWALFLGAALSAAQALLPGLAAMTALRIGEGFSHLAIVVSAPPLMAAAAADRDRPVAMGVWAMFFGVSFAIAARIIPWVLATGGLPLLFLAHGAGLVLLALVLAPMLPRMRAARTPFDPLREHLAIYSTPRIAAPALGFVFYTVTLLALLTFLPDAMGRPDLAVTLPLVSLGGTFLAGWAAKWVPPHRIALVGFAGTAGFALLLGGGAAWAAYGVFLAQGLVPGAAFAAIPHLNASDADRARATGAIAQLGNLGTTSGPVLFALVLGGGLGGLVGLLVAFSLAGLFVVWSMHRAVRRAEARPV